jgi:hypothetical protein
MNFFARVLDEIADDVESFQERSTVKRTFEHSKKDDKLVNTLKTNLASALDIFRVSLIPSSGKT